MPNNPTLEWEERFYSKINELGFHLGYLQKPRMERLKEFISHLISEATTRGREEAIGIIGAKLLAKHSPQAVLDAYFEVANEELENHEKNN